MMQRGWNSPFGVQYRPYGEVQQVLNIVEELKKHVASASTLQAETQKAIQKLRRDPKDIHRSGAEPLRSWDILAKGV